VSGVSIRDKDDCTWRKADVSCARCSRRRVPPLQGGTWGGRGGGASAADPPPETEPAVAFNLLGEAGVGVASAATAAEQRESMALRRTSLDILMTCSWQCEKGEGRGGWWWQNLTALHFEAKNGEDMLLPQAPPIIFDKDSRSETCSRFSKINVLLRSKGSSSTCTHSAPAPLPTHNLQNKAA
jgi:hypothetical protein